MPYVVYILECSDGSYYTGSAADLSKRMWEHQIGVSPSAYTYSRRPVKLMWTSEEVARYSDALRFERQIKGWSRAKKEALIGGSYEAVHEVVKRERKQREKIKRKSSRGTEGQCFSVPQSKRDLHVNDL
jgi:putative endonuclease